MRKNISSGSKWEDIVGYSRAVRIGNIVEVSGTVSADGSQIIGKGDVAAQTRYIFHKIEQALRQAGATLDDVVRTRMFVTDIEQQWEIIGGIHGEFFKDIRPVTTMVEVSKLIDPDLLVEIEVQAVLK